MQNSDHIKTEPLGHLLPEEEKEKKKGPYQKAKEESKTIKYLILTLKYLLLAGLVFLIGDGSIEIWQSQISWFWKFLLDLTTLMVIAFIILYWKSISLNLKISILSIYFTGTIFFFTAYFGTFQDSYRILEKDISFISVLLLTLGTAAGIFIIIFFPRMPRILKIILSVAGLYVLAGNIHVIATKTTIEQGFEGIWLWKSLPLFLRPTIWAVFFFIPLTILLILIRIIIKSIKKEKPYFLISAIIPLLIINAMGLTSFYTKTASGTVSFEGLEGSLNVLSRENGGEIVSFSTQLDLYDHGVFRLNDGDIDCYSPFKWICAQNTPFPHEMVFSIGGPNNIYNINRIIIYGTDPGSNRAIKEFELYSSMDQDKKSFKKIKTFTCENTPLPQEFTFKSHEARFVKISILSNWGNETYTEVSEIEVYSDNIPLKPLKISKNIASSEYDSSIVSYSGVEKEENKTVKNLINPLPPLDKKAWEFDSKNLPQEVTFRPAGGGTYLIDKILLEFPLERESNIKDIEILVSSKSPTEGFKTVWKTKHNQNAKEEIIKFSPALAAYVKIKILSTYSNGSPLLGRCRIFQSIVPEEKKTMENKEAGLKACYFPGLKFRNPVKEQIDKKLDFLWENGLEMGEIKKSSHFINWKGYLAVPSEGLYELAVKTGGGFRLYLDEELIIDSSEPGKEWHTTYLNLAEKEYKIEVYYYKRKKDPKKETFKLAWKKSGSPMVYFKIDEKTLENLKDKIKTDRLNNLKAFKDKEFTEADLYKTLEKAGFIEKEIELIINNGTVKKDYEIIPEKYFFHIKEEDGFSHGTREGTKLGLNWLSKNALQWQEENRGYGYYIQTQTIAALSAGKKNNYKVDKTLNILNDYLEGAVLGDGSLLFEEKGITSAQYIGTALAYRDRYTDNPEKQTLINIARWLSKKQEKNGMWKQDMAKPPLEENDLTVTANCLITLKQASLYDGDLKNSLEKGENWLRNTEAKTVKDLAHKIMALSFINEKANEEDLKTILAMQNEDGGWGEKGKSSPFITGLVICGLKLSEAGGENEKFMKGINYLLENQEVTGKWSCKDMEDDFASAMWPVTALASSFEPLIIDIKTPEEGQEFSSKSTEEIILEAEVSNSTGSPVYYVEYMLGEQSLGKTGEPPYRVKWNPSDLSPGNYTLEALAVTKEDEKASCKRNFSVYGPFKISITEPKEGDTIGLESTIKVEIVNKSEEPVEGVEYFLKGKTVEKITAAPYDLVLNTKKIPAGKYELKAVAYKKNGETVEDSLFIKIEKAFTIEITEPKNNEVISGEKLRVKVSIENDTGYDTEKVEYYLKEKLLKTVKDAPYSLEYNTKDIMSGEYNLKAVVINENNDRSEDEINTYIESSLKIAIKSLKDGDEINKDREVEVKITNKSDSSVEKVEYFIDDTSAGIIRKEPYSMKIFYEDLEEGEHKIKAVVYSEEGGTSFSEVIIKKGDKEEEPEETTEDVKIEPEETTVEPKTEPKESNEDIKAKPEETNVEVKTEQEETTVEAKTEQEEPIEEIKTEPETTVEVKTEQEEPIEEIKTEPEETTVEVKTEQEETIEEVKTEPEEN